MSEQRYRFGGPIPESVLALQKRRRHRSSEEFEALKKARRGDLWANPPAGREQIKGNWGEVVGIRPSAPVVARPVAFRFLEDATDRLLTGFSSEASPSQSSPGVEASSAPVDEALPTHFPQSSAPGSS